MTKYRALEELSEQAEDLIRYRLYEIDRQNHSITLGDAVTQMRESVADTLNSSSRNEAVEKMVWLVYNMVEDILILKDPLVQEFSLKDYLSGEFRNHINPARFLADN